VAGTCRPDAVFIPARLTSARSHAQDMGNTAQAIGKERSDPARRAAQAMKAIGLRRTRRGDLVIRRVRCGSGFAYQRADGRRLRDAATLRRLKSLAVPPAYEDVRYAVDPSAHLQAVGRDAAGRLQYRYHPEWEKVRERRKADRLVELAQALPRIRRVVARHMAAKEPTRELALAAVADLVLQSAIRPGSESYLRLHGTRGAATLLKSNAAINGPMLTLTFRAKRGQPIRKTLRAPRLIRVIRLLHELPGRRLFQYRDDAGEVRAVRRRDVNAFLCAAAGVQISLKDIRTLTASVMTLEALAQTDPAPSKRGRRRQVLEAVRETANDLDNTPAVCRRSYVHDAVVDAFENGVLQRYSSRLRRARNPAGRERVLALIVANGNH
jgi:DNA topoisomerase-1